MSTNQILALAVLLPAAAMFLLTLGFVVVRIIEATQGTADRDDEA